MLRCPAIIAELERALFAARGREIGGLLFEDPAGRQRVYLAPNLSPEPGAFEAPGWWLQRMLQRRDASGFRPIAFLHSHLSTLELSDADRVAMRGLALPWIVLRSEARRLTWAVYHAAGKIPSSP